MRQIILGILTLIIGIQAQAGEIVAKVKSVSTEQEKILVVTRGEGDVLKGQKLQSHEECELKVLKVSKNKAVLSTINCMDSDQIKPGKVLVLQNVRSKQVKKSTGFTSESAASSEMVSQGFRFSLAKAFFNDEYVGYGTNGDYRVSEGEGWDTTAGLGVGYAYIRNDSIGVMGGVLYNWISDETSSIRAELSATYGMFGAAYGFLGIHYHDFLGDAAEQYEAGSGLQLGLGYQVFENFGVQVSYVRTAHYGNLQTSTGENERFEYRISGAELSIHMTF